jgi:uncharacterized membrane protein
MAGLAGRWIAEHWVAWNLLLALVPLGIAVVLFAQTRADSRATKTSGLWWAGLAAFVVFLPNAPYVITDLIHLRSSLSSEHPGLVFAKFGVLVVGGSLAYVACIALLRSWLRSMGMRTWPIELTLHALCTVGIALGRIFRFNSWDVVLQPHSVAGAIGVPTVRHTFVLGCVFALLCCASIAVRLNLGIRVGRSHTQ